MFDSENLKRNYSDIELLNLIKKKVLKKEDLNLQHPMEELKIEGKFGDYLDKRILILLSKIKIDNSNAKISFQIYVLGT